MSTIRTANLDDKTMYHLYNENEFSDEAGTLQPAQVSPKSRLQGLWEAAVARTFGSSSLTQLTQDSEQISGFSVARLHTLGVQTMLAFELLNDVRAGTYRGVSWRALPILAGALRMISGDLKAFCAHKGYSVEEYFPR
jgi:hypothetical protein